MSQSISTNHDEFQRVLFERVKEILPREKWSRGGTAWLTKLVVSCALIASGYTLFVCGGGEFFFFSFLLFSLGSTSLAFNATHDSAHRGTALPLTHFVGKTALGLFGASHSFWSQNHHNHHAYVNVVGKDHDLALGGLLRTSPLQPHKPLYRFQLFYLVFAYGLLTVWMVAADALKYFDRTRQGRMHALDHASFWGTKIIYGLLMVAVPVFLHGGLWAFYWIFSTHLAVGTSIAFVFQVSHVNLFSKTHDKESRDVAEPWAIRQISSTANFAVQNRFLQWWIGGVGLHIEHHLFPKINHVHLARIQPVVERTCLDFGVPYVCFPTFRDALVSHIQRLRQLS